MSQLMSDGTPLRRVHIHDPIIHSVDHNWDGTVVVRMQVWNEKMNKITEYVIHTDALGLNCAASCIKNAFREAQKQLNTLIQPFTEGW